MNNDRHRSTQRVRLHDIARHCTTTSIPHIHLEIFLILFTTSKTRIFKAMPSFSSKSIIMVANQLMLRSTDYTKILLDLIAMTSIDTSQGRSGYEDVCEAESHAHTFLWATRSLEGPMWLQEVGIDLGVSWQHKHPRLCPVQM
jgi:hypothetical protein